MGLMETILILGLSVSLELIMWPIFEYMSTACFVIVRFTDPSGLRWNTLMDEFDDNVYKRCLLSSTIICSTYSCRLWLRLNDGANAVKLLLVWFTLPHLPWNQRSSC